VKNKQEVDEITRSYLNLQTPKAHRGNVIIFFLIFLDIMGLLPILGDPFSPLFFELAIGPIVFIHVWGILYILAPYKFEKSYYLFFGIYGVMNTYVYFLVIQKFLYMNLGVTSIAPFIVGVTSLLALLVFIQYFNLRMLHSGTYAKLQTNKQTRNMSPYINAAGFGYVLAQIFMSSLFADSFISFVLMFIIALMSIVTAYFSIYIHRYIFIRRNYDIVKKLYPEFGLPKKQRKYIF